MYQFMIVKRGIGTIGLILYDMHIKYGVSLYIKFHYSWWNDKNLDRFAFLS